MSVLRNIYDLERHIDETWYDSTNVVYSKFIEDENENKGDLYVVFKGGKQYLYKSVSYQNYLSFKKGIVEGSSGKALNQYIIKVYEAEKVDDADINELVERLNSPDEKDLTYFIHGDGKLDEDVFQIAYLQTIEYVLSMYSDSKFVVKNDDQYSMRSAEYLLNVVKIDPERITIYIKKSDYDNLGEEFQECRTVKIKDDEYDQDLIDREIMKRSFEDIGYVSEEMLEKIAGISRTAYIILTRRMS